MAKLIVVCGATGNLGGSTARRMLKEGWQVRGITRNQNSTAAKALTDAGAELASANYDDVASLENAFQGANAIFGITNMFEYLMDNGPNAAAERETQQLVNIASAAGKTSTLEHLILHTLPAGEKVGGKGYYVPHLDGKDKAMETITETLPDVAKKTTFLWLGMFASNFYTFPMMKPVEVPNSYGSHVYFQPTSPNTRAAFAGDVERNVGTYVNAILAKPDVSLPSKIVFLYTEIGSMQDYLQSWIDVTGRRTTYLQVSQAEYEQTWGPYGKELGLMFKAFEPESDWTKPYSGVVTAKDLGIESKDLLDHKAALEKDKDKL